MTPFEDLLDRYYGKPGTPERTEFEHGYKKEVNKLLLDRMLRRIKAQRRR